MKLDYSEEVEAEKAGSPSEFFFSHLLDVHT